ncbi:MAG: hypothetical protein L0332_29025, partial [Chloroflexi bacterium]|nr:hypothetical protein [Chloroflexota bacterium]MCI0648636.1 hypothetical protein [Chloroflexota bacterium]MCI0730743.1 hypothetical protein [Chloroflexota bacterium]
MIEFISRSADGQTFTLAVNGERRTYSNDKDGKRQAVIDGLDAIETISVGQDVYLPSDPALQVVATILYPAGIQTKDAYETVCQVTEKACAHVGYGEEVQLGPPQVPFTARGAYRKKYPPVDAQLVLEELERAGVHSYRPRQEVAGRILWNKAGVAVYDKYWSQLSPEQQQQIQAQVEAIAAQAGWQVETAGQEAVYVRPLAANVAGA